jgi:hypothetical protein
VIAAPAAALFERALVLAVGDALLGTPWSAVRDHILASVASPDFGSARRRAFIGQIIAEAAGAFGDVDTALAMLGLERCPHLASVRCAPAYAGLHAQVVARAVAVQDALFGEHRGRATADTLPNTVTG